MPCYAIDGIVPIVDGTAFVHPTAVLIGDVSVGPDCYIGPCASLRGDFGRIIVKAGANIQDSCTLHSFPGKSTVVEENGHIGHGAVLHGCIVEHDALVGINAVILDGAKIGAQSIVGACALVSAGMQIADRSLVVGVPAKVQRQLMDHEISRKCEGTLVYQDLARRCKQSLVEVMR
jgi:phenylacetic acid degradation protein